MKISKLFSLKRAISFMLLLSVICSFTLSAIPASALHEEWVMVVQNDSKWTGAANTYGTGTLRATGCGIFSLVNAVGFLTGNAMNVNEVAAWAYSIGAYNKGGADGTYRYELYPYVEAKFGERYGFTMNCNGTQGWWASVKSSVLINHLNSGGVAVAHVPGHFIAIVDYNASTNKYHVLDSYPTNARQSYPGDVWLTQSHLTTVSAMTVDWFCLLSEAQTNKVKAPTISSESVVAHNANLSVSWGAVTNATSYNYKAEVYQGETSATTGTVIASGTTTSTSFTVPAQASGKYIKVTVTAVGPENTAAASKTVMLGPWIGSYPTNVEYIPVADINGSVTASSSSLWTAAKGTSFGMTWWRAFLCSPNADGTYTVNTIYENGVEKSVPVSGNQVLWVIHSGYQNYSYAAKIVNGDKLTFVGAYLDNATIRGNGYVLVNGGVPIGPDSLTIKDSTLSYKDTYIKGTLAGTTKENLVAKFNESAEFIVVKDMNGNQVSTGVVATGYTVNLIVNSEVRASYTIVVDGDVSCDGIVSTADMLAVRRVISGSGIFEGVYKLAADTDGSDNVSTTDFAIIRKMVSGS